MVIRGGSWENNTGRSRQASPRSARGTPHGDGSPIRKTTPDIRAATILPVNLAITLRARTKTAARRATCPVAGHLHQPATAADGVQMESSRHGTPRRNSVQGYRNNGGPDGSGVSRRNSPSGSPRNTFAQDSSNNGSGNATMNWGGQQNEGKHGGSGSGSNGNGDKDGWTAPAWGDPTAAQSTQGAADGGPDSGW